jgi:hypothetical protein
MPHQRGRSFARPGRREFLLGLTGWSVAGPLQNAFGQPERPDASGRRALQAYGSREALAQPASVSWPQLQARIRGMLLQPGSPAYESSRHVWNAAIDRRPAAILVCASTADVIEGVRFATAEGLKVSVRGGGHNVAGRSVQTGALLIDLSRMREVRVNTRARPVDWSPARGWAVLRWGAASAG